MYRRYHNTYKDTYLFGIFYTLRGARRCRFPGSAPVKLFSRNIIRMINKPDYQT